MAVWWQVATGRFQRPVAASMVLPFAAIRNTEEPTVGTRYLYPVSGGGSAEFYESDGTIYRLNGGGHVFYISEGTVYSYDGGRAVYWISDNYLYEYGSGQARFYFSD